MSNLGQTFNLFQKKKQAFTATEARKFVADMIS
jgi:hypothetical protein